MRAFSRFAATGVSASLLTLALCCPISVSAAEEASSTPANAVVIAEIEQKIVQVSEEITALNKSLKERGELVSKQPNAEVSVAQKNAEQAQAAVTEALANDPAIIAAKAEAAQAQAAYDEAVADAIENSKEIREARKALEKQAEALNSNAFEQGLVKIKLTHQLSPIAQAVNSDASVKAAAQALANAESAANEKLQPLIDALNQAKSAVSTLDKSISEQPAVASSRALQQAANATIKEQQAATPQAIAAAVAREELNQARTKAFSKNRANRKIVSQIEKHRKEINALSADENSLRAIVNVIRRHGELAPETAAEVSQAQEAVNKITQARSFSSERKAHEANQAAYDAIFTRDIPAEKYAELEAKRDQLKDVVTKKTQAVINADSIKTALKALTEFEKTRQEHKAVGNAMRAIRMKSADLNDAWHARAASSKALSQAVQAHRKGAAANETLDAAKAKHADALTAAITDNALGKQLLEKIAELNSQQQAIELEIVLLNYERNSRHGAIQQAVTEAIEDEQAAFSKASALARSTPSAAANLAKEINAQSKALNRLAIEQARNQTDRDALLQSVSEASKALATAREESPDLAAVKEARLALQAITKDAQQRHGTELIASISELREQEKAINSAIKSAQDAIKKASTAITQQPEGQVAKAKESLDAAQGAIKAAQNTDAIKALKAEANSARKAIAQARKDALTADQEYSTTSAAIKTKNNELKDLRRSKKQAEKPAPQPKKKKAKKVKKDNKDKKDKKANKKDKKAKKDNKEKTNKASKDENAAAE